MKKGMFLNKKIAIILTVLYDILSIFWCYVISANLVYNFTKISVNEDGIGIIGGADMPTLLYQIKGIFMARYLFSSLFLILSITTVFLLTVSTFKKQASRKLYITLCVFLSFTLIVFLLTPAYSYIVAFYALINSITVFKFLQIFYIVILALNIVSISRMMKVTS